MIDTSLLIALTDINIKKNDIEKYIRPGSVIDVFNGLSSNKLNKPNKSAIDEIFKILIWNFGFANKKIFIRNVKAKISEKKYPLIYERKFPKMDSGKDISGSLSIETIINKLVITNNNI